MTAPMRAVLTAAREEACLISADAITARAAQTTVQHAINPVGVRAAIKEATAETSILGHHLTATGKTTGNILSSTTSTAVQNALKDDLPTTLREAVSQATQAGVEEQGEKAFLTLKTAAGMPVMPPVTAPQAAMV